MLLAPTFACDVVSERLVVIENSDTQLQVVFGVGWLLTSLCAVANPPYTSELPVSTTQTLSEALRSAAAQLSMASARAAAETDALLRRAEEAEAQLSTARAAADQLQRVRILC